MGYHGTIFPGFPCSFPGYLVPFGSIMQPFFDHAFRWYHDGTCGSIGTITAFQSELVEINQQSTVNSQPCQVDQLNKIMHTMTNYDAPLLPN